MFTGFIKEVGLLQFIRPITAGLLYRVKCDSLHRKVEKGGSVAVDGICQSVTDITATGFEAIAGTATLNKTTLLMWRKGRQLHLEPALSMGEPLDGHLVQGHIKDVVRLEKSFTGGGNERRAKTRILRFRIPDNIQYSIGCEDSVAIDGVSLTVSLVTDCFFEVNILPDTLSRTHLLTKKRGDFLNFEPDFLKSGNQNNSGSQLTNTKLLKWGYL